MHGSGAGVAQLGGGMTRRLARVARSACSSAAIIAPLLAVADPRIRRTPGHWTGIDRHCQTLRV